MIDTQQSIADEIIVVGDRVDIVAQAGLVYRAMIEDRIENGPFLIAIPSRKGVPMTVYQNDDIYLVFYRETGRYIAQMKVIALEKRGALRYMWLLQKTKAQKNQRRDAYRLPVSFNVRLFEYTEDMERGLSAAPDEEVKPIALETAGTRDISVTGIALLTKKEYILEERYILEMHMEAAPPGIRPKEIIDTAPPLQLTATVKRCIPWRTGKLFNTGMHFIGMTRDMSEGIAKYVLTEQQRQIKQRRQS
ncbi:MAG: flagellar brake protein [Oscillospiraceae bacterium]|nr:flagellar brake protein [Oscillospiraceae bacterium]